MKKGVPERWEKYLPMGCRVPGTRFLPFKVPLKPELCRKHPEDIWFTPSMLLENTPMLKAVIDLTDTNRYYNSEEFTRRGVLYEKINFRGGGKVPPRHLLEKFFDAVDQLCSTLDYDSDALIGVHCTHGLNRTGYLICKYMVLRMKIDPQEAINKFQEARGYKIERRNFLSDIISEASNCQPEPQSVPRNRNWGNKRPHVPETINWRKEPRAAPEMFPKPAPYGEGTRFEREPRPAPYGDRTRFEREPRPAPYGDRTRFEREPRSAPYLGTACFQREPRSAPYLGTSHFQGEPRSEPYLERRIRFERERRSAPIRDMSIRSEREPRFNDFRR